MEQKTKKKQKGEVMRTPVGTAIWPKLGTADTKFATTEKPHGHYSVGLVLPMSDPRVASMIERLEELRQEAIAEGQAACKPGKRVIEAQYGWSNEVDEQGQETGNVVVNLKKPGAFERDDGTIVKMKVDAFDSAGGKLDKATLDRMGSGTKLAAIFEASKFATGLGAGVSLRLQAVQVRELVEFGSRSAEAYGFETDGSGFVANPSAESDPVDDGGDSAATAGPAADTSDI